MSDKKKYDSDTLSQQRKSREEFLRLKRMQSGETPAPPPMSSEAVLPKTLGEKIKSYWYYYRWIVIGALLISAVIAISVAQCATRTKYDYNVVLLTREYVGDADAAKIAEYFEQYTEDINGDGEIHVQVCNCSYDEAGNITVAQAKMQKFAAMLQSDDSSPLFILDKKSEDHLAEVFPDSKLFDGSVLLNEAFYEFCDVDDIIPLPRNLKLLKRYTTKETLEENEQFAKAMEIADKIIAENDK